MTESATTNVIDPVAPAVEDNTQVAATAITGSEAPAPEALSDRAAEGAKFTDEPDKSTSLAGTESPQGAPEDYSDFYYPEGYEFPSEQLNGFCDLAKELNLSQGGAQNLMNYFAKVEEQGTEAGMQRRQQELSSWEAAVQGDPDLGGGKFKDTMVSAKRAFNMMGTPELATLFNERGVDGNIEIVRLFKAIDDRLGEASLVTGKPTATSSRMSNEQVFFPNGAVT